MNDYLLLYSGGLFNSLTYRHRYPSNHGAIFVDATSHHFWHTHPFFFSFFFFIIQKRNKTVLPPPHHRQPVNQSIIDLSWIPHIFFFFFFFNLCYPIDNIPPFVTQFLCNLFCLRSEQESGKLQITVLKKRKISISFEIVVIYYMYSFQVAPPILDLHKFP